MVHGNCQAEAVRVVIDASTDAVCTVRMPPVHELTADDLPALARVLARADVIASQPVADGYRDLPIGTAELARLAPRAQVIRWPVVRYVGLHPYGALVRRPWRGDPPVVPYHDLRTILAVARGLGHGQRPTGHGRADGFRAVAAASLDGLRERERAGDLVAVADLVEAAGDRAMHTINHPGNAVLVPLAERILRAAGIAAPGRNPGRTLLGAIEAPVAPEVLEALGLPTSSARSDWHTPDGVVTEEVVAAGQYDWYTDRADLVAAALDRYSPAIEALGL